MKSLVEWIVENPGKCVFLRTLVNSGRVPLSAGLFESLPESVELLVVRGRVDHVNECGSTSHPGEQIRQGLITFFVLTKHELLVPYVGQNICVIWKEGRLHIEVITA